MHANRRDHELSHTLGLELTPTYLCHHHPQTFLDGRARARRLGWLHLKPPECMCNVYATRPAQMCICITITRKLFQVFARERQRCFLSERCSLLDRPSEWCLLSKTVPAFGMALAFGKVLAFGTVHTAAASTRQWLDPKRAEHACIGEYAHVTKLSDAHLSRRSETQ